MADKEESKDTPPSAAAPAFDLADLAFEDTAEMTLSHPITGAPTDWTWVIAGPSHPASVKADRELGDETRREEMEKERARVNGRKWKGDFISTEDQQKKNATWLAKKVLNWTPVKQNGKPLEFSYDNVKNTLLDPRYGWVYRQLLDFIIDERSFIKPF